jgi:hypothetical protein
VIKSKTRIIYEFLEAFCELKVNKFHSLSYFCSIPPTGSQQFILFYFFAFNVMSEEPCKYGAVNGNLPMIIFHGWLNFPAMPTNFKLAQRLNCVQLLFMEPFINSTWPNFSSEMVTVISF